MIQKKHKNILVLTFLWLLVILLVNPTGDFPINDDWCYAKSVQTLYEQGRLKLYNWGEMTLVAQVYWGYLFVSIFGFSFTVLRISTLILALASIIGIYELLKLIKLPKKNCFLTALICLINPLFVSLSFSFMTDVPFYFTVIWAIYYFIKHLKTDNFKFLVIAVLFCVFGLLIRQIMLVLPVAWLVTYLLTKEKSRKNILKAVFPLIVLLVVYLLFIYFMEANGALQKRHNSRLVLLIESIQDFDVKFLIRFFGYFFIAIGYIGLLFLPMHLFSKPIKTFSRKTILFVLVYTISITSLLILTGKTFPCLNNVLINFGVGPTTLYDFYGNVTETPYKLSHFFFYFITFIGVLSSAFLLMRFKLFISNFKKSPELVFAWSFFILYLAPFLIVSVYDRYLLPLFPVVLIVLLKNNYENFKLKITKYAIGVFVLVMSWFSISATHDYMTWNRLRWKIISELQTSGVSNDEILGGIEHSAWYHFSEEKEKWWETSEPTYAIVFTTTKSDIIVKEFTYKKWLSGVGKMYLIKKN